MPRTFIAASTPFIRRGPNRRTSAATSFVRASCANGRVAARRHLRAPDRPLPLGFAAQTMKELGARRAGLGVGARPVQKRRPLFLLPAFERVHCNQMKFTR